MLSQVLFRRDAQRGAVYRAPLRGAKKKKQL
jgi:hypothetical protein